MSYDKTSNHSRTSETVKAIKRDIDAYIKLENTSPSAFGLLVLNDPNAYWRLNSMTVTRLQKIEDFLAKHRAPAK